MINFVKNIEFFYLLDVKFGDIYLNRCKPITVKTLYLH